MVVFIIVYSCFIDFTLPSMLVPSVLWCCWLGGMKGIWPAKNWVVGCWSGYLSGALCRLACGLAEATTTHCHWFLPFWYWLTRVVLDKGPWNVCVRARAREFYWSVTSLFYLCALFSLFLVAVFPPVPWRCWLGSRKGIRPVKNWVVGCLHGYMSGAKCRLACGPADATATHCLLLQ